jgi:NADP-dependent aldehyde dehydrogenase
MSSPESATLLGLSLIGGRPGKNAGPRFHAIDPATGATLPPHFHEAAPDEIDAAMQAAAGALATTAGQTPVARACFLDTIASGIESLGDALLERCHAETGLPLARLSGERARTCAQLRLFARVVSDGAWVDARIDPALPDRKPLPRPDLRRMLVPIGPVVVFGASNFPLAFSVAGGDTASALAAGCPVVFKAHPAHPGTCEMVAAAIVRAARTCEMPGGVFSLLHGGAGVGLALVRHPAAAAVAFTGSHAAGRAIFDAAMDRPNPIPVFAEMSSANPVFLLPGALDERGDAIAGGLVASSTLGVGQFCTKPGLVFGVDSPAWTAFGEAVAARARDVAPGVMLHVGIADAFSRAVAGLSGVEWLARGPGAHIARVDAATFSARPDLAHEIFGPFTLLVTAPDAAGLRTLASALDGQLTATLHGTTQDLAAAGDLVALLATKAGRLVVDGFPTGVEVSPAMQHGGPYPATTDARFTSVGTAAIQRFARPVCYQNFRDDLLPDALKAANPLGLLRLVDGHPDGGRGILPRAD